MKAFIILGLRVSTGLLLVLWGLIKLSGNAVGVSDTYYFGLISAQALQLPLGIGQILLGLFVCLGLLRRLVYPIQSFILFLGAAFIIVYLLDPLGLYLWTPTDETSIRVLFFPSLCVFFATLVPLAYKEDDRLSLDKRLGLNF